VAEDTVKSREDAVRLLTDQVRVGYISQLQQSQALAELESVRQSVQQLSLALQRQRIALLQLVGGSGDDQAQALARSTLSDHVRLESMSLPAMPAPGLPSCWSACCTRPAAAGSQ
jgi:outer membrane protein TolC